MRSGEREEGCRGEGDLSGYIASGKHVILGVLSRLGDGVSRLKACTLFFEDLAEGGEEVGARFDDEVKAAASSGIADVLLSLMTELFNAASCMTETGGGAGGRLDLAIDSCVDQAFRAFFVKSAAIHLAGEGGGIMPAHNTALGSESVHGMCTDKGRGEGPIQVLKGKD